ncbi:hypothetical protein, partial [Psychromonas sp. Urea-02u-13]|uniref:hypothetical protein n=1 Tax=Psychromonas sp. Urea-02u-13 TaxID=2058326 RepID=UPI000CA6736C
LVKAFGNEVSVKKTKDSSGLVILVGEKEYIQTSKSYTNPCASETNSWFYSFIVETGDENKVYLVSSYQYFTKEVMDSTGVDVAARSPMDMKCRIYTWVLDKENYEANQGSSFEVVSENNTSHGCTAFGGHIPGHMSYWSPGSSVNGAYVVQCDGTVVNIDLVNCKPIFAKDKFKFINLFPYGERSDPQPKGTDIDYTSTWTKVLMQYNYVKPQILNWLYNMMSCTYIESEDKKNQGEVKFAIATMGFCACSSGKSNFNRKGRFQVADCTLKLTKESQPIIDSLSMYTNYDCNYGGIDNKGKYTTEKMGDYVIQSNGVTNGAEISFNISAKYRNHKWAGNISLSELSKKTFYTDQDFHVVLGTTGFLLTTDKINTKELFHEAISSGVINLSGEKLEIDSEGNISSPGTADAIGLIMGPPPFPFTSGETAKNPPSLNFSCILSSKYSYSESKTTEQSSDISSSLTKGFFSITPKLENLLIKTSGTSKTISNKYNFSLDYSGTKGFSKYGVMIYSQPRVVGTIYELMSGNDSRGKIKFSDKLAPSPYIYILSGVNTEDSYPDPQSTYFLLGNSSINYSGEYSSITSGLNGLPENNSDWESASEHYNTLWNDSSKGGMKWCRDNGFVTIKDSTLLKSDKSNHSLSEIATKDIVQTSKNNNGFSVGLKLGFINSSHGMKHSYYTEVKKTTDSTSTWSFTTPLQPEGEDYYNVNVYILDVNTRKIRERVLDKPDWIPSLAWEKHSNFWLVTYAQAHRSQQ